MRRGFDRSEIDQPHPQHRPKSGNQLISDSSMKLSCLQAVCLIYCTLDEVLCGEHFNFHEQVRTRRAFFDTPYGQIHYKYGGDFACTVDPGTCYTFLFFHGNPRSLDEFKELVDELAIRFGELENGSSKFFFIAVDLLGEGHSDDPNIDPNKGYVSMKEYAEFMIEITDKVLSTLPSSNVTKYIIPLGSLTGSAIATELSYQLAIKNRSLSLCKTGTCEVPTTILHDPMYYFSDQIVANVHSYANLQRNWKPDPDGQHLMEIWNDLNYQPYKDLNLQDRKSLDRFRAASTQWQVIMSYTDYSSEILLGRLTALSKLRSLGVEPLTIIYGGEFLNDPMMEKVFQMQEMKSRIMAATQGGVYDTVIDGGNQALLSQNVTIVADIIMKQVKSTRDIQYYL